ncbi:MAG TPA: chitinase [Ktedonobacteraceae bacterium]|nr:chitinase [Ktedonobacteraceae bacterium]
MNTRKIRLSAMVALLLVSLCILTARFAMAQSAWPTNYFAPYSFQPDSESNLVGLSQQTGTKFYTLAFIINSTSTPCQASWNATEPIGSWMQARISALQAAGGDVSASFGGASGTEVADSCATLSSLEAQYHSVITTYNLTHLDFDIEGKTLANKAGNKLRNQAIAALQAQAAAHGRQLAVSYTLSVNVTGLPQNEINLLQDAIHDGVNISVVNIMTMDYYSKNAPGNQMGQNAIKAAKSTIKQLQSLYPWKSTSQLWTMLGLTPMIGVNDDPKEIFTLQDAQTVLSFAERKNIAELSFWDVQRDHQCNQGQKPPNHCTGVTQQPYQYDQTFAPFTTW